MTHVRQSSVFWNLDILRYITQFPPAAAPARENRIAARGATPGTRGLPRATLHDPWLPCSDSYHVCQSAHAPLLLDLATQERVQRAIFDARRHFARGGRPRYARAPLFDLS